MRKKLLIHPQELSEAWIRRMVENDVQVLGIHPVGGEQAHHYVEVLLQQMQEPSFRELIDLACSAGMEIEYELHAASFLLPRELFRTHPDWFRMDETGKRTPSVDFCMSHPEAVAYAADRAAALTEQLYRSSDRYYFWLDDAPKPKCLCPSCRERTESDLQLQFLNQVLRRLRQNKPNAQLAYLAYYETMALPQKVKADPGIFLEYAPIQRDAKKPIAQQTDPKTLHQLLDFFGREASVVLEYWFDNSLYSKWTKPPVRFTPDHALIVDDMAWYRNQGFEDLASFACYLGEDYEALYDEPDITAFNMKQMPVVGNNG